MENFETAYLSRNSFDAKSKDMPQSNERRSTLSNFINEVSSSDVQNPMNINKNEDDNLLLF